MQRTDARALIVDLRLNNGGNAFLTNPLPEVVSAFARGDSSRRIFVISGRSTFSAAQIFLTRLERLANVIIVGEPSSSSPNFVGEDGERLRLPYSGVVVNISFKRHQESHYDDRRQWIPVSLPTPLTWETTSPIVTRRWRPSRRSCAGSVWPGDSAGARVPAVRYEQTR